MYVPKQQRYYQRKQQYQRGPRWQGQGRGGRPDRYGGYFWNDYQQAEEQSDKLKDKMPPLVAQNYDNVVNAGVYAVQHPDAVRRDYLKYANPNANMLKEIGFKLLKAAENAHPGTQPEVLAKALVLDDLGTDYAHDSISKGHATQYRQIASGRLDSLEELKAPVLKESNNVVNYKNFPVYNDEAFSFDAVNTEALVTQICPHLANKPPPWINDRVAVARVQGSVTGGVNAAGNGAWIFQPRQLIYNSFNLPIYQNASTTLNLNTGSDSAAWISFPTTAASVATSIDCFMPLSAEITITSIAAVTQAAGAVMSTYFQNGKLTSIDGINNTFPSTVSVAASTYYQCASMGSLLNNPMRQVSTFDITDVNYQPGGTVAPQSMTNQVSNEFFMIEIIGATASTTPIRIDYIVDYMFQPVVGFASLITVDYPPPGAGTSAFYQSILKAFPALTQLSSAKAQELAQKILSVKSPHYQALWDLIMRSVQSHERRCDHWSSSVNDDANSFLEI